MIVFPPSVKQVCLSAFRNCKQLESVRLNDSLEELGEKEVVKGSEYEGNVFAGSGVASVRLPPMLGEIKQGTFYECKNLKNIEFPEGLRIIGNCAFQGSGLEDIILPASLRTIAQGAFCECQNLKTVKFCEGPEVLGTNERQSNGGAFRGIFEGSALECLELPRTLRRMGRQVFKNCGNLKCVTLPQGVELIGEMCFCKCGLENICFPSSVGEIRQEAFYGN